MFPVYEQTYGKKNPKLRTFKKLSVVFLIKRSLSQYLLHLLALGQLVYEFVEVASLPGKWILNFLDAVAANSPSNQRGIGMEASLSKEGFQGCFFVDQLLDLLIVKSRQPSDDLMKFCLGSAFFLHLRDIVWIDRGEGHLCNSAVVCFGDVHVFWTRHTKISRCWENNNSPIIVHLD
jgi:hypothetical protein